MPDPVLLPVPVAVAVLLRERVIDDVPEPVMAAVGDTLGVLENVPVTVRLGDFVLEGVPDPEPDPVRVLEGVFVLEGVCVGEPVLDAVFEGVLVPVSDPVPLIVVVLVLVCDELDVNDAVTEGVFVIVGLKVVETDPVPLCVTVCILEGV